MGIHRILSLISACFLPGYPSPPGLSTGHLQCLRDLPHSPSLCCVLAHSPACKLLLFPWEAGPGTSQSQQIPNVKSRWNTSFGWKMQHPGTGELSQHGDHLSQSKLNLQSKLLSVRSCQRVRDRTWEFITPSHCESIRKLDKSLSSCTTPNAHACARAHTHTMVYFTSA